MTRPSCHRFRANEVRVSLSVLAYNLGNLWRRLALPRAIANSSLTSLRERMVKTGSRLVKHARYYWFRLAEGRLTRRLFAGMLGKIATLSVPAGVAVVGATLQIGRAIGRGMERCLGKSASDGLERGFGSAAMIESAASVAGRGPAAG